MGDKIRADEIAADAVQRSYPNRKRPRLKTAAEDRLADIERRSAECYASMEELTSQLSQLATHLDQVPINDAAIPEPVEGWENDSLVQSVQELQTVVALPSPDAQPTPTRAAAPLVLAAARTRSSR